MSGTLSAFWWISGRSWAVVAVLAAVVAGYANSLGGGFVFDDVGEIAANPAVRTLWPPTVPMFGGNQLAARPLPYLLFALDFRFWGVNPVGYHLTNLAMHACGALLLLEVLWQVLAGPRLPHAIRRHALPAATATAAIWGVHPLTTQAVTYVYQRIEMLAAVLMLASLLAAIRAFGFDASPRPRGRGWIAASLVASCLAMLSKETAVVLPLLVPLCFYVFAEPGGRGWVARHWRFCLGLAATWGVLAAVLVAERASYSELRRPIHPPLDYLLTQAGVILHYLRLCVWPAGLLLDHDWPLATRPDQYAWQVPLVAAAACAAAWGAWWRRPWGFPAAAFFLLLAPTSSLLPVVDIACEHRMYLPLACVVGLAVGLATWAVNAVEERRPASAPALRRLAAGAAVVVVLALATTTHLRNRVYRDRWTMWHDVLAKNPTGVRANWFVGTMLADRGDVAGAVARARIATERDSFCLAYQQIAQTLCVGGDVAGWERACRGGYEQLRRLGKSATPPALDLGAGLVTALLVQGRTAEAAALLAEVRHEADAALPAEHGVHAALRSAAVRLALARGETAAAVTAGREAVARAEEYLGADHETALEARGALAVALAAAGNDEDAEPLLRDLVGRQAARPANEHNVAAAAAALASFLESRGRPAEAIAIRERVCDEECRRLGTRHPAAQRALRALAETLDRAGRPADAASVRRLVAEPRRKADTP
jgi:hypothetical protein